MTGQHNECNKVCIIAYLCHLDINFSNNKSRFPCNSLLHSNYIWKFQKLCSLRHAILIITVSHVHKSITPRMTWCSTKPLQCRHDGASEITSLTIVDSTVHSGADQRKHQWSPSLAFVWGIHRWAVNSPHKWPVTRKMFPSDDVIMHGGGPGRWGVKLLPQCRCKSVYPVWTICFLLMTSGSSVHKFMESVSIWAPDGEPNENKVLSPCEA